MNDKPYSIERAATALGCDRRTLARALAEAKRHHFITPCDHDGTRKSPRWTLRDACEALERWRIDPAQASEDKRPFEQWMIVDWRRALAMPCPRCGGFHVEMPILPQPGKRESKAILEWFAANNFR